MIRRTSPRNTCYKDVQVIYVTRISPRNNVMIDLFVFVDTSDTPIFKAVLIESTLHSTPLPIFSFFNYLGNVALAPIYKFIIKLSINIITSIYTDCHTNYYKGGILCKNQNCSTKFVNAFA